MKTKSPPVPKNQETDNKTCGNCKAYRLGILEIYCQKRNIKVSPDNKACKNHILRQGEEETVKPKTKINMKPKEQNQETAKKAETGNTGLVRIHNAARSLKVSIASIREIASKTGIDLLTTGEGKAVCKALRKEDVNTIKSFLSQHRDE